MLATVYSAAAIAVANAAPAALEVKKVKVTGLDWLGTYIAIASIGGSVLFLIGMAIWMIYKALTQSQALQTSWNPPQEQTFESFAQSSSQLHSKSWMFAFAGAALFAVVAIGLYFGVAPQKDKAGETMDMSTFDRKGKAPAAPTPAP